ncbi:MAG: DEAD/DEAH box helicase [Candidatus Omnitrophota bacterium]
MKDSQPSFYHLGIAPDLLKTLEKMKFVTPTPIQYKAIPIALEGKDIMGIAQTGTGKTMAFGIPTVQRLLAEGGRALVLVPTRELAIQVAEALNHILKPFKMSSAVLIGGVKIGSQLDDLRRNPDILIATPGRMNDHIYQGTIDLGDIRVLILDEADRMFDMGFAPQVNSIIRCLTNKRQTMLFSATMPKEVVKLATSCMEMPINVEIAPTGTTTKDVTQELFIVREAVKNDVIRMLLNQYRGTVLVFTRTKIKAMRVTREIRRMGEKVAEIHSNRSMEQRNQAIEGFKRGRYRVLVATDIAARGIDISMIELVVNYDLPDESENYIHRIGRTGRAGREGHAVTLATPLQSQDIDKIEKLIKMPLPRSKHPEFSGNDFSQDAAPSQKSGRSRRPSDRNHRPGFRSSGNSSKPKKFSRGKRPGKNK